MKKTSNFKASQESAVFGRKRAIKDCLASLKKTRAKFEYPTDLAKAVASQLELTEKKPCSYTTLLRNWTYKSLLLEYMLTTGSSVPSQVRDPVAQSRIYTLELDLSNATRDNERLRMYVTDLEERGSRPPVLAPSNETPVEAQEVIHLSNERALACKALWLVLKHFEGLVSVDSGRGCIIDLASSQRNNVIVEREVAKVFLDWIAANSWIGN
jgi:hypothetical protein